MMNNFDIYEAASNYNNEMDNFDIYEAASNYNNEMDKYAEEFGSDDDEDNEDNN